MLQKILIFLNLGVAILAAIVVLYSHLIIKPPSTNQNEEYQKMINNVRSKGYIEPMPMKKMVVNIETGSSKLRFLEVELNIVPYDENQKENLKNLDFIIQDIVIDIASEMTPDELNSITGKILFENRIKKNFNQQAGKNFIKSIFFSRFIIQ